MQICKPTWQPLKSNARASNVESGRSTIIDARTLADERSPMIFRVR